MEQKVIVTSYTEPDLDGFSCAFAYAEFLNKTGIPAAVRFFGEPHIEALYLVQKFGFKIEEDKETKLEKVVLVDASESRNLDASLHIENIIEVIDHRKVNEAASFINAKIQIEFVGAAATLVAEKFHAQKVAISIPAATLLYGAIVSNTLNFRGKVTTDRDRAMAEWLKGQLRLPENFIADMFRAKSDVSGKNLKIRIDADFGHFVFGKQRIGYAQLEIMDAKPLAETREAEILAILKDIKSKEKLDHVFISLIDLGEGFNAFITDEETMKAALSEILGIPFKGNLAYRPGYIMRKELAPLLKEKLS